MRAYNYTRGLGTPTTSQHNIFDSEKLTILSCAPDGDIDGIFNVRTNLGPCRTHEGGLGTNKSEQELTRRDRKHTVPHPAPPRGSNPGSSDLNSDSLTTELRPPVNLSFRCCCCSVLQLNTQRVTQYVHPHPYKYKCRYSP